MPRVIELRASNAHRWIACPGQPQAVAGIRDSASEHADRGTVAHALLEIMLRLDIPTDEIDRYADRPLLKEIDGRPADHIMVDEDMMNGVSYALDYVRGYLETNENASFEIECALDATPFIGYECGGTSDVMLVDLPREIVVVDYKNGVQHVDHADNAQLHIYALGALNKHSLDVTTETAVRMVIVQPNSRKRDGPVREVVYTYDDLMRFAKDAALAARKAHGKNPPRAAGDHCSFCRAAGHCRTYADRALQTASLEFSDLGDDMPLANPTDLKPADVAKVLESMTLLRQWLVAVENEAITRLVNKKKIPGFKLVASTPHRRWDDMDKVVALVSKAAPQLIDELIPRVPLTPSRMEKRLSRKRDGLPALLTRVRKRVTRNPVEPRIAPVDDTRPPYQPGQEFEDD